MFSIKLLFKICFEIFCKQPSNKSEREKRAYSNYNLDNDLVSSVKPNQKLSTKHQKKAHDVDKAGSGEYFNEKKN